MKHYDLSTYAAWDSLIRMQVTSTNVVTVDGSPQDTSNAGMPYGSAIGANELLPDSSGKVTYEFAPDSSFSGIIGMSSYPDFNSVPENSFLVINPGGDGNIYLLIDYETFTLSYLGSWDKSNILRLTLDYTGDSITIYKNGELIFSYAKTREETMYPIILPLAEGSKVDAVACNFGSFTPLTITDEVHHCDFEQNNGSITLTATSGEGITYHWSNSATTNQITNLSAGTYSVTVNSHNGTYIHNYDISTYAIWDTLIRMEETTEHIVAVDGSPVDTTNAGMPLGVAVGANELFPDSSGSVTFEFAPDSSYSGIIGMSSYPDFVSVPENSFLIINPGDDGNIYFLIDYETFTLSYLGAWDKSSILILRLDYTSDSVMVYKNGDLIYSYAKTRVETMYPAILPLAEGSKVNAVATSIPPSISPPIAPPSQTVCSDTAYTFTFDSIYTHWDSIEWAANSAFTSSTVIPKYGSINITVDTATTDTIWLRSINTSGKHSGKVFCMAKNLSRPIVIINPKDTVVIEGSPVVLKGGGGNTFDWHGLNSTIDTIAITSNGDSTYYSLSITDSLGCTNTDSAVIRAIPIDVLTYINHKDTLNYDDTTDIEIFSNLSGMYVAWYRDDTVNVTSDTSGSGNHIQKKMVNNTTSFQTSSLKVQGNILGYKTRPVTIPVHSAARSVPDIAIEATVGNTPADVCTDYNLITLNVTINASQEYFIQLSFPTLEDYELEIVNTSPSSSAFSVVSSPGGSYTSPSFYERFIRVDPSAANGDYTLTCKIHIPCSQIPTVQQYDNNNNPVSQSLNIGLAVYNSGNYQIGNMNGPGTFAVLIKYPYIRNINSSNPISITAIANGQTSSFTTIYENTGSASFSGVLFYEPGNINCHGSADINLAGITAIIKPANISVSATLVGTEFQIDFQNNPLGIHDRIEITQEFTVTECLDVCTIPLEIAWGCSATERCVSYTNTSSTGAPNPFDNPRINIEPDAVGAPHLYVSRITPEPFTSSNNGNEYVWDATCTNSSTSWEFLIESKGQLPSNSVDIDLSDAFFNDATQSPYSYTYVQNCSVNTTDTRFITSVSPTLTIASSDISTTFLTSTDFLTGHVPNCFTDRSASSNSNEHPVKNYHIHIDHLEAGQAVVVSFETYRCCPDDNYLFNNGINFNHWQLKVTGVNECGGILLANLHDPAHAFAPSAIRHTYGTNTTYLPFNSSNYAAGYISANAFDDASHPDLFLAQSFMPFNSTLSGDVTDENTPIACGDAALFRIKNTAFPSDDNTLSDFDFDLFSNTGNNATGLQGQFKIEFDLPTGLQIDAASTPSITLADNSTWSPPSGSYFPSPGGSTKPYVIFDIPSQFSSAITAQAFRLLFVNSIINFQVIGCCGDGIDPNPLLTVNTYFNPKNDNSPNQTCDDCWIPLSSVARQTHIHCPGCVTPGIIIDEYSLRRITLGYQDANDNGRPDADISSGTPALIPITNPSAYYNLDSTFLNMNASIPGDELRGVITAHIQDGAANSAGTGFSYAEWVAYWNTQAVTALLPELYLEQVVVFTDNAGNILPTMDMVCTEAVIQYFDASNSSNSATNTFTISSISNSTPLSIGTDGKFLFHISASDLSSTTEFTPHDRFVLKMKYHICDNPQLVTNMEINNTLFLAADELPNPDPLEAYLQTPQSLEVGDGPEAADPVNDDLLYVCEGFSGHHTIYPIRQNCIESYKHYGRCMVDSGTSEISYFIGSNITNTFPYEYRPLSNVDANNFTWSGPQLQNSHPISHVIKSNITGFDVIPARLYTRSIEYLNQISTATKTTTVLPPDITTYNYPTISPTHIAYCLDAGQTNKPAYSADFEGNAIAVVAPTSTDPYSHAILNNNNLLFISDESFVQGFSFNLRSICSTPHYTSTVIEGDDVFVLGTDYSSVCDPVDAMIDNDILKLDNNPNGNLTPTLTINHIGGSFTTYPGGPPASIGLNSLLWPITIAVTAGQSIENPLLYFKNTDLSGITINGLVGISTTPPTDCSSAAAPTVSGNYTIFELPQTMGGTQTVYLCITSPDCADISIPYHIAWSCDGYPDPNDTNSVNNNCQHLPGPMGASLIYTNPNQVLNLTATIGGASPLPTCTDIPITLDLLVNSGPVGSIGIGDLSGQIWLPAIFSINTPTLIINGTTHTNISVTSSSNILPDGTVGNLWEFDFNHLTDFNNSSSVVGTDGITTNDNLQLLFNISALCNASTFNNNSYTFKLPYRSYCKMETLQLNGLQFNFEPCSQASPEITVTPAPFSCTSSSNKATLTVHPLGQPTGTFLSGTTFEWSTSETTASIDVSQAGTYSVTVTEPGSSACPTQASITVPLTSLGGIVVGDAPGVGIPTLLAALSANVLLPNSGGISASNTSQNIIVKGNFTINADYTFFNNSEIICDEGARIYINANNTLTVDEGVHIHGCDYMWRGIVVNSRANILLNGSAQNRILIEDAYEAVSLSANTTYKLQYVHFNNNFIGLYAAMSTSNVTQPISLGIIEGNQFTSNSNLKQIYSNFIPTQQLPNPSINSPAYCGIYLNNILVFKLGISNVPNLPTNENVNIFSNICNGVLSYNSMLFIRRCHFEDIQSFGYSNSPQHPIGTAILSQTLPPAFGGFHNSTISTLSSPDQQITIENCAMGISAIRNEKVYIRGCVIRNALVCGIKVERSIPDCDISIINNNIISGAWGIYLLNNEPVKNISVTDNFVVGLGLPFSNNGTFVGKGVEILESGINNNLFVKEQRNRVWMPNGIEFGIHNSGVDKIHIDNNQVQLFSYYSEAGIFNSACQYILSLQNIVRGPNATYHNSSTWPMGIHNFDTEGKFKCDDVANIYNGIVFDGSCLKTKFQNLSIGNATVGMHYMNGSFVRAQPDVGETVMYGNKWPGAYGSYAIENNNPQATELTERITSHTFSVPYFTTNTFPSGYMLVNNGTSFITDCSFNSLDEIQFELNGNPQHNYLKTIIGDDIEYGIYAEELKWQNQWSAYKYYKESTDSIVFDSGDSLFISTKDADNMGILYHVDKTLSNVLNDTTFLDSVKVLNGIKDEIIELLPIIDSLMDIEAAVKGSAYWNLLNAKTEFYDSLNVIDSLISLQSAITDSIRQIPIDSLKDANSGIIPVNLVEENMQLFNDIYLNTLASGVDTFTEQQIEDIAYLAFQCPLRGGEVVFRARSLYAMIADTIYNDEELCDTTNNLLRRSRVIKDKQKAEQAEQDVVYQLYPNPAKNSLTISSNVAFCSTCRLQVYDLTGKLMLTTNLPEGGYNTRLNIANLQTGLYVVNINNGQGNLYNTKLSIIK